MSWLLVVSVMCVVVGLDSFKHCEPMNTNVKKDLCKFTGNQSSVQFPNSLGMESQEEAIENLNGFELLLKSEKHCSSSLAVFLCHTYLPICYPESPDVIIKPCRAECEMSRANCSALMLHYHYPWPSILSCDKFQWHDEANPFCVGNPAYTKANFARLYPAIASGNYTIDRYDDNSELERPMPENSVYNGVAGNCEVIGLHNARPDHVFNNYSGCGLPCESSFYGAPSEQEHVRYWNLAWASLCLLSCLFTIITFLFDQERFRYPERAIILSALCYFFVAIGFILGFVLKDGLVCEEGTVPGKKVVRQSGGEDKKEMALCFIQFFLIYYFLMASFLWWVVLNLTWLLAAGLKWGHEAISYFAKFFHLVAWVLPAAFFVVITATNDIDGDRLANICFVGNFKTRTLQMYVIGPLVVFYLFGMTFLGLGLVSMYSVRRELHHTGKKTDKLETLMIRIGLFSVLYSIPATVLISCFLYENFERPKWEDNYVRDCFAGDYHCLSDGKTYAPDQHHLVIKDIKYLMMLVTGLSTGFWVLLSFKTASRWGDILLCRWCKKDSETAV